MRTREIVGWLLLGLVAITFFRITYRQSLLNKALQDSLQVLRERSYTDSLRLMHYRSVEDSLLALLNNYAQPLPSSISLTAQLDWIFKTHLKKHDSLVNLSSRLKEDVRKQLSENHELVLLEKKLQQEITTHKNLYDSTVLVTENQLIVLQQQIAHLEALVKTIRLDTATFISPKGVSFFFLGKLVDGKPHGLGVGFYEKKGYYIGEWAGTAREGKGKHFHKNGDVYEGEFENDLRSGYGVYYYTSGEIYKGEWKNDLMNGKGEIIVDGKSRKGYWVDGKMIEQELK